MEFQRRRIYMYCRTFWIGDEKKKHKAKKTHIQNTSLYSMKYLYAMNIFCLKKHLIRSWNKGATQHQLQQQMQWHSIDRRKGILIIMSSVTIWILCFIHNVLFTVHYNVICSLLEFIHKDGDVSASIELKALEARI